MGPTQEENLMAYKSITQEMKDYRTRIMQMYVCPSTQFGVEGSN
jgi:hypothetical protein